MPMTYHTTGHETKKRRHRLEVLDKIAECQHNGRIYRVLLVQTQEGLKYVCVRLHNADNHFIKQFLFEPELTGWFSEALRPEPAADNADDAQEAT